MEELFKIELEKYKENNSFVDTMLEEGFKRKMELTWNVINTEKSLKVLADEEKKALFTDLMNNVINLSELEQRRILIRDEAFEEVLRISYQIKVMAEQTYLKATTEKVDKEEYFKTFDTLLPKVMEWNKEEATRQISEASEDILFINNPEAKSTSFRLASFIKSQNEER